MSIDYYLENKSLPLSYRTTRGNLFLGTITTDKETRASEAIEEPLSPERRGFNKWWATNPSSSFLTPLTSYKGDTVGTVVFTFRLGIMPGLLSSMMPKVLKYGVGATLVWYPRTLSLRRH